MAGYKKQDLCSFDSYFFKDTSCSIILMDFTCVSTVSDFFSKRLFNMYAIFYAIYITVLRFKLHVNQISYIYIRYKILFYIGPYGIKFGVGGKEVALRCFE